MPNDTQYDEVKSFIESEDGRRFLDGIRDHLTGHVIDRVDFLNSGEGITTVLRLDNGQCYALNDEELLLETLREQFSGVFRELEQHNKTP